MTLAHLCDGDARVALNSLQNAVESARARSGHMISMEDVKEGLQRSHVQYDRAGEEHYNCISALIKSMRGSNDSAAIYWLSRMLEGGEDPKFVARRLIIFASEDIGVADSQSLVLGVATYQACHFIGMPECALNLAHCVVHMSRAPKSTETYTALKKARESIRHHQGLLPAVPLHLRNAPTKLMKDLNYGVGYQYNPACTGPVEQDYLPPELLGVNFFAKDAT
ncbi:hypothetical protein NP493_156g00004 [Ridgeia piscesae]|uniref:ATPase WRNIP1 n=1 Tax=Ridgeia piscesae TaxID=27915 RepID=A0AAD9UFU1_RIDPI|nr:hypothetical protein NP493_156g00004 [Ridgeia piscesae]